MEGCKIQLIMKYQRRFLVSKCFHFKFMIYIRKSTNVSILVQIPGQQIEITTGTYKFPIKFWQNINEELVKVEYLVNFSQYFENFTKSIIGSCNKTFLRNVSKTLAEFDEVFNFGKFLIYALAKFN